MLLEAADLSTLSCQLNELISKLGKGSTAAHAEELLLRSTLKEYI